MTIESNRPTDDEGEVQTKEDKKSGEDVQPINPKGGREGEVQPKKAESSSSPAVRDVLPLGPKGWGPRGEPVEPNPKK